MYILTSHANDPDQEHVQWSPGLSTTSAREMLDGSDIRHVINDYDQIARNNQVYKQVMAEKAIGRPGHYYGRDVVLEGSMPVALFIAAAQEFGADPDWWKDDKKFDNYMLRHPEWDWRKK